MQFYGDYEKGRWFCRDKSTTVCCRKTKSMEWLRMVNKQQHRIAYKSQEKKLIIISFVVAGIMFLSIIGRIFSS